MSNEQLLKELIERIKSGQIKIEFPNATANLELDLDMVYSTGNTLNIEPGFK